MSRPAPTHIETWGSYAPSLINPLSRKLSYPNLGYWLPLAITKTTTFPSFLGKSSRETIRPQIPLSWENWKTRDPLLYPFGGGGGGHEKFASVKHPVRPRCFSPYGIYISGQHHYNADMILIEIQDRLLPELKNNTEIRPPLANKKYRMTQNIYTQWK